MVPAAAFAKPHARGAGELFSHDGHLVASGTVVSKALADDGKTALIVAPDGEGDSNAVFVYVRRASRWSEQARLTESGNSAALAGDGRTAIVGDAADNNRAGAAWVFVRSGHRWVQQGGKLTPSDESGTVFGFGGGFGDAVALSEDGSTALIGGSEDHFEPFIGGAAWVFTRSHSAWSQQGPKLVGKSEFSESPVSFGERVSLSADGNTALIGSDQCHHCDGEGWIFTRSGTTWSQEASFVGDRMSGLGNAQLADVALSSDGNTAMVSTVEGFEAVGRAFVFVRSGGGWVPRGGEITPSDAVGDEVFGESVDLSGNGDLALISGSRDDEGIGAVWVFERSGAAWAERRKIAGAALGARFFGSSVALSSDASAALISGQEVSGRSGVWGFRARCPDCPY